MTISKNQSGFSLLNTMFFVIIAGFLIMLAVKLVPVYVDDATIQKALQALQSTPGFNKNMDTATLQQTAQRTLEKYLYINNVRNVDIGKISIKRLPQGIELDLAYTVQVPIMSNIDALVHFDHHALIAS